MTIPLLGWAGSAALAVGLYGIGNKRRGAFLFSIVGETLWIVKSVILGMWDLAAICIVFWLLAARSWWKWRQ